MDVAGGEVVASVAEGLAGTSARQHVEGLVEQGVALVEVDAEGEELALEGAGTGAEHEPSTEELSTVAAALASRRGCG